MPTDLELAPGYEIQKKEVFADHAQYEAFWDAFYAQVKEELERLEQARALSEEDSRNLWLR